MEWYKIQPVVEVKEEKKEVEEACVLIVRESKKVGVLGWSEE